MPINVRGFDRDQQFLMPPSLRDWLSEDHLAWFVADVVDALDLSAFFGSYRDDGRGGATYDPALMLAVLLYAYCSGERSSRRIEAHLVDDVAYRVLAANQRPDHATLARFRARHQEAIAEIFAQVLGLCVAGGLVDTSLVAIDGTKMAADAAASANRTKEDLAAQILKEAATIDAAEDERFGERRGDEAPKGWQRRQERRQRIKKLCVSSKNSPHVMLQGSPPRTCRQGSGTGAGTDRAQTDEATRSPARTPPGEHYRPRLEAHGQPQGPPAGL